MKKNITAEQTHFKTIKKLSAVARLVMTVLTSSHKGERAEYEKKILNFLSC